jgi:hypothetical protein
MTQHLSHFSSQLQRPIRTSPSLPAAQHANGRAAPDAQVAKRAYEKYEEGGRIHGHDQEDWAAASRELVAEIFG